MAARILTAEDDPNPIVPLQFLLERHVNKVMAVYEGTQALEALPFSNQERLATLAQVQAP